MQALRAQALALGFSGLSVTSPELSEAEAGLMSWLQAGMHGEMDYMSRYGHDRARVGAFVAGAVSVLSLRMNYWPEDMRASEAALAEPQKAYISRYALGRDYHKVIRQRLQKLVEWMQAERGDFSARVFTDSAPVMEVALASKAGLGWRGKNTLLLNREHGSAFFLGEIVCDLKLPMEPAIQEHCGTCQTCIDVCPTQAIIAPYQLDARRCISYLTIEHKSAIPVEFRKAMGNRIYGCDDCQLACPWNKFAQRATAPDFLPRNGLIHASLAALFRWTASEFNQRMEGSAIRRIGHERWLRNIAVALGNAHTTSEVVTALRSRINDESALVREHVAWALVQHEGQNGDFSGDLPGKSAVFAPQVLHGSEDNHH